MSNPVTINSPALRLFGTAYAAYAMQIVDAVNASPYLQELFAAFESRTLADGSKPAIMLSGWDENTESPLPDTHATDQLVMISPAYFPTPTTNESDIRILLLNLTKDLAHEIQHSNTFADRRNAEAAELNKSDTATALVARVASMHTEDEIASKVAEYNALKSLGDVASQELAQSLNPPRADGSLANFATPILQAAQDPANLDANGNLMVTPALRQALAPLQDSLSGSGRPLSTYGSDHLAYEINVLAWANRLASGETLLLDTPVQELINAGLDTRGSKLAVVNAVSGQGQWVRTEPIALRLVDPQTGVETRLVASTENNLTQFSYITMAGGTLVSVSGSVSHATNTVTISHAWAVDEGTMASVDMGEAVRTGIRLAAGSAPGALENAVNLINAARNQLGLEQAQYQPAPTTEVLAPIPGGTTDGLPVTLRAPLPPASMGPVRDLLDVGELNAAAQGADTVHTVTLPDGTTQTRVELGDGFALTTVRDGDRRILTVAETTHAASGETITDNFRVNADGTRVLDSKVIAQTDDTGNTLIITTHADGSGTARALDSAGHLINEATFQRDGGIDGTTGTLTETINGKSVVFGFSFLQDGPIELTGIESIDGQTPESGDAIGQRLQLQHIEIDDVLLGAGSGALGQLITVADPSDEDGMSPVIYPPDFAWSSDPASQAFAASLSSIQSLIAGLQSGKPLPTATGLFGLGATFTGAQALVQAGDALGVVNALVNLRDIFERGDVMSRLYNGAVLSSSALKLYKAALPDQPQEAGSHYVIDSCLWPVDTGIRPY